MKQFKTLACLRLVAEQAGLSLTWWHIPEDRFSHDMAQICLFCLDLNGVKLFIIFIGKINRVLWIWMSMQKRMNKMDMKLTCREIERFSSLILCCCCLFGFNVVFNNFSVISRRCLVATGSSVLTFIVLPHWSIMPQTLAMVPHPVTLF